MREKGVKIFGNYHTKFTYYIDKVNIKDKKKYNHPTIKPIELIERHIINSSQEGDIVLDCFMGSGTTGVACANTNRKFIGIELDNNYFNIASKRIEEAFFNAQNKEGALNE
jgi:DNA modification methylase